MDFRIKSRKGNLKMQNDVLAKTNKKQRILMAFKGENIKALIAKNEPEVIAKLIKYENGYCLDILFESDNEEILSEVIKHNLNYTLLEDAVMMKDYRHLVYDALMDTKDIPFKVIEKYFETKDDDDDDSPLELKYQAMQIEPTVIEKTMLPIQLFVTRNPLWALNLTGNQIKQVINSATGILELRKILK